MTQCTRVDGNGNCTATIRLRHQHRATYRSRRGDSGGAVYNPDSRQAFGVHHSGPPPGTSGPAFFTPIQNIIDRFRVRVVGTDAEATVLDAIPANRPSGRKIRENEDARFTIRLNYPTLRNVSVNFETADRTAIAGQDYVARSGTAVIPAGQTRVAVDIDVLDDAVRERDETFVLRLTGSSNAPLSSDTVAMAIIEAND